MRLPSKLPAYRKALLLLIATIFYASVSAQDTGFPFVNFSNKDGLSSNSVSVILKDKFGYMWFGTDDGLNRFDGTNFTVYRHSATDSSTIGGNSILAVVEDKAGNLWVGTDNSLSFYDRRKNAFVNHYFVRNVAARALAIDHVGILWVGTYGGLFQFDAQIGVLKYYGTNAKEPNGLVSGTVISLFEDSKKRLWVGTNAGLHLYNRDRDKFTSYTPSADPASIAGPSVRSIAESADGSLWFATDGGVSRMLPGCQKFINYRHSNKENSISSDLVRTITPDPAAATMWIGTESGLNILDPATGHITRISHDPRNRYSLSGKTVKSIYIDKDGIYWVGGYLNGVNKYDKNLAFFNLRQSNPLDPSGLTHPHVTSFVEDPAGNIYIGTDGGGLNLFHRNTGMFTHPILSKDGKPLSVIAMDRAGNQLLVATYQDGLYVLNMNTHAVKHYTKGNKPGDIGGNDIFCIKTDHTGKVWVGLNGQGVNIFDPATGTFSKFQTNAIPTGERVLTDGYIRAIAEDTHGNIWIGSQGSGFTRFDRATNTFRIYHRRNSPLPSNNILSVHADGNDIIWIGTSGGGLSLFDTQKDSFTSFSEQDGLSNAVIYKILEDDNGKIWLSSNKGLTSFDSKKRKFKNYSFQNGLQQSTFVLGAGIKTSNGQLFFGGLDGFNFFDPASLRCNKSIPSLAFTDLKISNRSVNPGERSPIKEHISIANEIRLDYKQNFSLEFAALNYTSPLDNRYSYKLDGFDKDWNDVGPLHAAAYTNLDPGVYTFRIRAKSDDGLWTTPEKTIRIYVKPPFWRTIYAYILYAVAAIVIVVLIRYRAIQKLKNRFAREQERLQFQTMLEEEKRERERQHEFDELKIKFLTNLSHEFRTPISLIVGPIEKVAGMEQGKEKLEQLGLAKRNARRLLNLVNQLLDLRKLENSELTLNCTQGDFVSFAKDIADSFRDMSERKDIQFEFSSALTSYHTLFDHDKIERILFNLLSNAFKFTGRGGKITLAVDRDTASNLKVVISDTGVGMSEEEKNKVFERFFQGHTRADILNQGSGIGLSITKEFVKLHGGDITLQSEPGQGSIFTISLPCEPIDISAIETTSPHQLVNPSTLPTAMVMEEVPEHEKLTLLIIEDNDDFRTYLRDNLKACYKIVEACNGKEGWQKALSSHPKVIVSDISMPGMDGITLSRKLKSDKRTSHIPIILLTALTGDSNQLVGLQTGASDYLTKPFNFEILHVKIRNLLALNNTFEKTYTRQFKVEPAPVDIQSPDQLLLQKVIEYIETNLDQNVTVEELSKHVFMTRGSLYSKILNLTGETPVEFIRSIKLNKAAALMEKNSDMKITEIAYAVGFSTANYFTRAFKTKFNISPTEYLSLKKRDTVGNRQSTVDS